MKTLLLFFSIVSFSNVWSQSLQEANQWFDNYEYAKAAEVYASYAKSNELALDDYKRYTYSQYITGEYAKCLPLVEELVKDENVEPIFVYIDAECKLGLEKYDEAKAAYIKYQSLDNEYNVENKIASCDFLKTATPMEYTINKSVASNSSKADFTGGSFGKNYIRYKELGLDSLGTITESGDMSRSELFLVRPLVVTTDGSVNQIMFPDSIPNISIPSIAYSEATKKVYFTVMQPTSQVEIDAVPHIYEGDFDATTNQVSNMKQWKYSGYSDTSACGYATLNDAGNKMVFSKIGSMTQGADLFISSFENNAWTKPTKLEKVNTPKDEMFPLFIGDSLLSFSSDGQLGFGGLDIYLADWNGTDVGELTYLSKPVNSVNDDFNFVYYSADSARYSSNRIGGKGDDDIYFVKFREPVVEEVVEVVPPFVAKWVDQIIYFDFNKFTLKTDDKIIDELIIYLKENSGKDISVVGHTDNRGSDAYNKTLGLRRANQVKDELVKLGIDEQQIIVSSKGKDEPQVDCSGGCSEEEHAKNRYVIIQLNK